jgi:Leucine-rich repeat (LRR) protein
MATTTPANPSTELAAPAQPQTVPAPVALPSSSVEPSTPPRNLFLTSLASILQILCYGLIGYAVYRIALLWLPLPQSLMRHQEMIVKGTTVLTPVTYFQKQLDRQSEDPLKEEYLGPKNLIYSLPDTIGQISTLQFLEMRLQPIRKLPDDLALITDLTTLHVMNSDLTELPETIGNLTSLQDLTIVGTHIKKLPDSIGNLKNLVSLNLAYNDIESLPDSLENLTNLKFLTLTGNNIRTVPKHLPADLELLFIGNNPIGEAAGVINYPVEGGNHAGVLIVFY